MSYYLNQIEGSDDDDDYYSEEEEEEEFDVDQDQQEVEEEDEEEKQRAIEQQKASLSFQSLSTKKQQNKKNKPSSTITTTNNSNKKKDEKETNIIQMTEEEMEHYQNLKLYGISGPKKQKKTTQISEEIKFKLDVLQSSKMFFESMRPISITIISGNPKYEEQKRYILRHAWEARKGKQYANDDAMIEGETTAPKFLFQDITPSKINDYVRHLMNRSDHLSTLSVDERSLFVYGGRTGTVLHDDLIRYDFMTGKMAIFRNLGFVSHCGDYAKTQAIIPSLSNSDMVSCGSRVYILGGTYSLSNSFDDDMTRSHFGYYWGNRPTHSWKAGEMTVACFDGVSGFTSGHLGVPLPRPNTTSCTERPYPIRSPTSDVVPARSHFSLVKMVKGSNLVEAIMFGGKKNTAYDDLYMFTFTDSGTTYDVKQIKKPTEKNNIITWPSARYGHSAVLVSNLMFVFGGCNAKGKLLNDLYMFDISTQKWTEIVCDSMLPPPLYKHQSFSVNNQSLYIYGGQSNQESNSSTPCMCSSLFRFDITDKKWNIIEIITEEADDIQNNKALPCAGHQCQIVQGGKMLRVGGLAQNSGDPFVKLLNLNDPGRPIPLCSYLDNKRNDGFLCDVVFRVRDVLGQEVDSLSYILAHKAIIKARCSSLHKMVTSSTETMSTTKLSGTFNDEMSEITLVNIEQLDTAVFEQYINYIYTGSLDLKSSKEVNSLLEFVKVMSPEIHYPIMSKICTTEEQKDLEVTKLVLSQLHKDLATLINDHSYSDLIVVLDQAEMVAKQIGEPTDEIFEEEPFEIPETSFETSDPTNDGFEMEQEIMSPLARSNVPSGGIAVHRLIMARSPFFSRMFVTSGMMESKERVVHLSDYSTEVMLEVLSYLYTDTIRLSPRNCLGILVYCIMLDLVDMASVCRRLVVSLLEDSIVWSVIDIAMLYNDKTLESECEHYILKNFEKLRSSTGFLNLPELTRIKIKQSYEKKAEKKSKK